MSEIITFELKLPVHLSTAQLAHIQRLAIHCFLHEKYLSMPDALAQLSPEDQIWLVKRLIDDAAEFLSLAAYLTDTTLRQHYWQQYDDRLGYLFHWHEHWSTYHSQLLSVLRTAVRRYSVQDLTVERTKIMHRLTLRLHDDRLYREDVFSAEHALRDVGWDTLFDLSPIADQLFKSYVEELGRA